MTTKLNMHTLDAYYVSIVKAVSIINSSFNFFLQKVTHYKIELEIYGITNVGFISAGPVQRSAEKGSCSVCD